MAFHKLQRVMHMAKFPIIMCDPDVAGPDLSIR